jgi:hypothetical protein
VQIKNNQQNSKLELVIKSIFEIHSKRQAEKRQLIFQNNILNFVIKVERFKIQIKITSNKEESEKKNSFQPT